MSTSLITRPAPPTAPAPEPLRSTVDLTVARFAGWLSRHSVDLLRVSLGVVFLAFGVLKFFPGLSPAEALATRTVETMTFGILDHGGALLFTAIVECVIGLTLTTGKFLRTGLVVLGTAIVGFFAPLVLFFGDMFPNGAPTLEAQYIVKDIVFAAAGLVIAAKALGARPVAESVAESVSAAQSTPDAPRR